MPDCLKARRESLMEENWREMESRTWRVMSTYPSLEDVSRESMQA